MIYVAGVLYLMDDILIFGKDHKEHDTRLTAALEKIQAAGVTLNKDKCEFNKTSLTLLGHNIILMGKVFLLILRIQLQLAKWLHPSLQLN